MNSPNINSIKTSIDCRIVMPAQQIWTYIKDLGVALRPMRFGILGSLIVLGIWIDTYTGQGSDVLVSYSRSSWGWHRAPLVIGTLIFAFVVWLTMYIAVLLRFGDSHHDEAKVMLAYRERFPAACHMRGHKDAIAAAKNRVRWILGWRKLMPSLLGASGPLLTGIFMIIAADDWEKGLAFVILACVFAFLTLSIQSIFGDNETRTKWKEIPKWVNCLAFVAIIILAFIMVPCTINPVSCGLFFGPAPIFFTAISFLVVIGTWLAILSRESHLPIFSIILVVLVVSHWRGHDSAIRYIERSTAENEIRARPLPSQALIHWQKKHDSINAFQKNVPLAELEQPNKPIPIIFVATAGGGSRAAYWTATVLGTLEDKTERKFSKDLFAISGVSGGSLGAAIFRTLVALPPKKMEGRSYAMVGQEAAAGDFLGPVIATLFTRDLLPSFSDINAPVAPEHDQIFHGDRAVALERSWETKWAEAVCRGQKNSCTNLMADSFLKLFDPDENTKEQKRPLPALLLNGTAVETGSRIITSNLKIECETPYGTRPCTQIRDVSDLLTHVPKPDVDVRVSTAVSNSARFPFIGPAAVTPIALKPAAGLNDNSSPILARIVDGGYFENFAATTLRELLIALDSRLEAKERKLLPIVIQISSDPELDTKLDPGYGRPIVGENKISRFLAQLRSPISAAFRTRDAHGVEARLALWETAEGLRWDAISGMQGHYFHFRLCRRGAPLAWVLSDQAQTNIKSALSYCDNDWQMNELIRLIQDSSSLPWWKRMPT